MKYMNNILSKMDEVIYYIKESDEYKEYLKLKEKMLEDKEILSIIDEIKLLQKNIVFNESKGIKTNDNKRIELLLNKLEFYPLYVEFSDIQEKLNMEFQIIKNTIEKEINRITN